ncbi:MAG TPA: sigma 54-interacting transcriptional regulator, partial [Burkholderiaceae bacterium]|nr:sigma 54-interacting transcriptional regulator [Burkholderiaceae bacterium]
MAASAWIRFLPSVSTLMRERVLALLGAADVELREARGGTQGYGLLVCEQIEEDVFGALAESRDAARILLIAVGRHEWAAASLWELLDAGAADVLQWPTLPATAEQVSSRLSRWETVREVSESAAVRDVVTGVSERWLGLVRQVVAMAVFSQSAVLVIGESGTGKELIARLIHELDRREDKGELIVVDCTTITPELAGSEFFGHERGAFTGAVGPRDGAFALADHGTLFLDEVGELPAVLQAQLLRVIQEGRYKRVGSNAWQHTGFRLVSATNRELEACVAAGTFRADLYYRIAGWVCRMPPLRERREDVVPLATRFQLEFDDGCGCSGFDEPVRQYLLGRDYPGNVRDLRRLVARLCHRHAGPGPITIGDVPEDERPVGEQTRAAW